MVELELDRYNELFCAELKLNIVRLILADNPKDNYMDVTLLRALLEKKE